MRKNLKLLAVGAACLTSSFALGIQTAGDVAPVSLIEAGGPSIAGDMDGSGVVDLQDVILILEVARGYTDPTVDQLAADPNHDGELTVDDALRLLATLSLL